MLGLVEDVLRALEGAVIQHVQIVWIFVKSARAHSDDLDATALGHSFAGEKFGMGVRIFSQQGTGERATPPHLRLNLVRAGL